MRIALIISSLECGGAEKVFYLLAQALTRIGHQIHVITLKDTPDFFEFGPEVHRTRLCVERPSSGFISAIKNNFIKLRTLRKTLKNIDPHVAISFMTRANVLLILATMGLNLKTIITEHTVTSFEHKGLWQWLRRKLYPLADKLVCISNQVGVQYSWMPPNLVSIIHNPILPSEVDSTVTLDKNSIVAVGRLVHEKAFDVLIRAFALVAKKGNPHNWSLTIVGEGPDRSELEFLIQSLNLGGSVKLVGQTKYPASYLKQAAIFVLSSRLEGFGNVIVEAMLSKVPVISTDAGGCQREIISDQVTGILVPPENPAKLAEAITYLMANPQIRLNLGTAGFNAASIYLPSHIGEKWHNLLIGLVPGTSA